MWKSIAKLREKRADDLDSVIGDMTMNVEQMNEILGFSHVHIEQQQYEVGIQQLKQVKVQLHQQPFSLFHPLYIQYMEAERAFSNQKGFLQGSQGYRWGRRTVGLVQQYEDIKVGLEKGYDMMEWPDEVKGRFLDMMEMMKIRKGLVEYYKERIEKGIQYEWDREGYLGGLKNSKSQHKDWERSIQQGVDELECIYLLEGCIRTIYHYNYKDSILGLYQANQKLYYWREQGYLYHVRIQYLEALYERLLGVAKLIFQPLHGEKISSFYDPMKGDKQLLNVVLVLDVSEIEMHPRNGIQGYRLSEVAPMQGLDCFPILSYMVETTHLRHLTVNIVSILQLPEAQQSLSRSEPLPLYIYTDKASKCSYILCKLRYGYYWVFVLAKQKLIDNQLRKLVLAYGKYMQLMDISTLGLTHYRIPS